MASKKKSAKKAVKKSGSKKPSGKSSKLKKAKPAKKAAKSPAKKSAKKTVRKAAPAKKPVATKKPAAVKAAQPPKVKPVTVDYTKAITPLLDRLVVRVINTERLTAGGLLIIPDTALMATGYLKAEVLAVGSGNKSKKGYLKPLDVKIGDKVLFAEYAGTKVQFNSEELHIIHEADVMGILEE